MHPGQFVSLCFVYLGILMLAPFTFEVLTGQHRSSPSIDTIGPLVVGIGTVSVGLFSLRYASEADWPEYGPWTYVVVAILVGLTWWAVSISL